MNLGTIGIWSSPLRATPDEVTRKGARLLDELGFHTLWIPGGGMAGILNAVATSLEVTSSLVVASGILSIWRYAPGEVATTFAELDRASNGRCVLGLGVSHAPIVNESGRNYARPVEEMERYLDALDEAGVDSEQRILAALGPRMLGLARDRSVGAHPYCVPVEHTKLAREALGEDAVLAPEVKVVFETDPARARAIARQGLDRYLRLDNYVNNLYRLGWSPDDVADGGSDSLVDALVGWGSDDEIEAFCHAHLVAGADHLAIQVLTETPDELPLDEWRHLRELFADLL